MERRDPTDVREYPVERHIGRDDLAVQGHHEASKPSPETIEKVAIGAVAVGLLTVGAVVLGLVAIGRIAFGRQGIRRRARSLSVDELNVGRLRVGELVIERRGPRFLRGRPVGQEVRRGLFRRGPQRSVAFRGAQPRRLPWSRRAPARGRGLRLFSSPFGQRRA